MLDELSCAGPEHLDAGYVAGYDAKSGFDAADDVRGFQSHGLADDWTVLDAGAGTGIFARAVAPHCQHVIAFDPSPAMTTAMREAVQDEQLRNVTVVRAGFLTYEHEGRPVDAAFSRNALHHLPDVWKAMALDRLAAAVKPGGVVRLHDLIFDFEPSEAAVTLEAWFAGAVDDPRVGYTREEFITHVRTEHSTYRWLFERMLDHAGLDVVGVNYRQRIYATYDCVRREPPPWRAVRRVRQPAASIVGRSAGAGPGRWWGLSARLSPCRAHEINSLTASRGSQAWIRASPCSAAAPRTG